MKQRTQLIGNIDSYAQDIAIKFHLWMEANCGAIVESKGRYFYCGDNFAKKYTLPQLYQIFKSTLK